MENHSSIPPEGRPTPTEAELHEMGIIVDFQESTVAYTARGQARSREIFQGNGEGRMTIVAICDDDEWPYIRSSEFLLWPARVVAHRLFINNFTPYTMRVKCVGEMEGHLSDFQVFPGRCANHLSFDATAYAEPDVRKFCGIEIRPGGVVCLRSTGAGVAPDSVLGYQWLVESKFRCSLVAAEKEEAQHV